MTGRAIAEMGMHNGMFMNMLQPGFGTEMIYSFVIILCSLMIYFGTRELYQLSNHKGIKFFRLSFLFFAIAYFFRSFIKFVMVYFNVGAILDISPQLFGMILGSVTLFVFMYFSSMAIFYLVYSVMWKKWKSMKIYLFHGIALLISFISIYFRDPLVYLGVNLFLFLLVFLVVIVVYFENRKKKKKNHLYAIYILLFLFWILNIVDILIPRFLGIYQIFIYLISIAIFLAILYKVIKKSGSN